ncbi:RNase P subunit p29-like protein [Calocera viscosa TUFC12733]|uniref:RNase P subunit p29-like protein n=1 Tax=Calocera viscosa (strain TUFC12733) TaxID=1330018 RepID=A0A167FVG5_CALVF|nr:RNase P subunit p29-like protein [Calocera viscosa TUFC12733]
MSGASTSTAVIDPYAPFSQGKTIQLSSASPFLPRYLASTLPPHTSPSHVYNTRLRGKLLILDNPLRESRSAQLKQERAAKREAEKQRRVQGVMGRREAKRLGVWELRKEDAKWALFLPIHHLWLGYIAELLQLPPPPSDDILHSTDPSKHRLPSVPGTQAKLVKADLHGSILSVKRAKNADLVGRGGIVVHETENTFKVVTAKDELKVLPKRNSVFTLRVPVYAVRPGTGEEDGGPMWEFELYGNQVCFRSSERASRKFKFKETIEL